jgi:hypothetical protein
MRSIVKKTTLTLISLVTVVMSTQAFPADRTIIITAGTVILLRMDTSLHSRTSRVGDRFTATVMREQARQQFIPEGSKVEGYIRAVNSADRMSRAGTIAIVFDRLVLPNGRSIPIDGSLTPLDERARESLDGFGEDGQVEGGHKSRRAIVFIGVGAGVGAAIGAVTNDGKGAAIGAGVGAVLGTIGVLLSRGEEAEVLPGTEIGMRVERAITLDLDRDNFSLSTSGRDEEDNHTTAPLRSALTSAEALRAAQLSLQSRGYFTRPISGKMTPATRRAFRQFQRDMQLPVTGILDIGTAEALGIKGSIPLSLRNW